MKKQNTARAHRFTVLDGIILAVLLLIVAGAVYFIFFADVADGSASEQTVPFAFTVECQNLADEFLSNGHVGDVVIDSVTKKEIGVVSAVENMPFTQFVINYELESVEEKEIPGQSNLLITISVDAELGEFGYHVDDYRIAVGTPHYLQMTQFVGEGYCISVQEQN